MVPELSAGGPSASDRHGATKASPRLELSGSPLCCVTVDVESDWGGRASPEHSGIEGCRYAVPRVLALFEAFGIRATFFVSSEVVGAIASELREITSRGHEIASHGWRHRRYDRLDLPSLDNELQGSKKILEDATGLPVIGFRSPYFVLHPSLFPALARAGYKYDSSLVAGRHLGRYCNRIENRPFWKHGVLEVPIGKLPFTPLPSGLLWLNLIGASVPFRWLPPPRDKVQVFYFHPFDLYPAKYTAEFDWRVNFWYRFRKKHVWTTLQGYLQRGTEQGRFAKMHDLLKLDWRAS